MESNEFSLDIQNMDIKKEKKWRKEIIISIIAVILIIAVIITLVVINSFPSKEEKIDEQIGIIDCYYNIESESSETQIISESYDDSSGNIDIYIEGQKISYSKKYKFEKAKSYNIQYKFKSELNMDYMFKNIFSLTNININLEKANTVKIKSMIGCFENCRNLIDFKIRGFDISEIKSLHKLFYNDAKLTEVDLQNFDNENNLENISYMFSGCSSLSKLNFSNFCT